MYAIFKKCNGLIWYTPISGGFFFFFLGVEKPLELILLNKISKHIFRINSTTISWIIFDSQVNKLAVLIRISSMVILRNLIHLSGLPRFSSLGKLSHKSTIQTPAKRDFQNC